MPREYETTIADADGTPHQYHAVAFGFDEGMQLMTELVSIAGPSLSALAEAMAPLIGEGGGLNALLDRELGDVLSAIGPHVGRVITDIARGVLQHGGPALLARLLQHVRRRTGDHWLSLRSPAERDMAYSGNYMEGLRACAWVIRANFFPSGWATMLDSGMPSMSPAPTSAPSATAEAPIVTLSTPSVAPTPTRIRGRA